MATESANRSGEVPTPKFTTQNAIQVAANTTQGTPVNARYIRLRFTVQANGSGNYSISSVRVYNDPDPVEDIYAEQRSVFRTSFSIDLEDEDLDEDLVEDLDEDLGDENLDDDANPELDPNALEPDPYALPLEDGDDSDLID